MENNFPFHKITPLENMIINLQNEGNERVLEYIYSIEDFFEKREQVKLYFQAIRKLGKGK